MNKLTVASSLVSVSFSIATLHAQDMLKTHGIYGNVEYGYTQNKAADINNKSSQDSFIQNYTLGKTGFLYSPNLMSYLLQGSLFVNDTQSVTNDSTTESSNKNVNYRVNTDFIRSTKYPFSLYDEKTSNPYGSVQAGSSVSYNQSTDRYGISGLAELPYFDLRYSAESSQMQRDETLADETRKNKDYTVSISKKFNEGTFSAVYNNRFRDYMRDDRYYQSNQGWNDHTQDARVNGVWNVDKTLRWSSSLGYQDSTYTDMKNLTGNVNVNWHPSERYTAGADLTANTISTGKYQNNTIALSGNSFYQMTPELSTTQNVSLYRISGDYADQTMGTVMLGGHYTKALENALVLNAGIDVMGKSEHNGVVSDANVTMPDRNTYAYTITGGASKMVESIRSNVSANLSYFNSTSTLDEKTERISANIMISSAIKENLYYTLSGYYVSEESQYFVGLANGLTQRDSEVLTIDNILRYWKEIGYDGKISLGGGVAYTVSQADSKERITRTFPHIDSSFTYRFFQSVFFNSTLAASQDSASDLTNYSAYMGLNYTLRKIMMSLGARYLYQTGGTLVEYTQSSAFFKISRTF